MASRKAQKRKTKARKAEQKAHHEAKAREARDNLIRQHNRMRGTSLNMAAMALLASGLLTPVKDNPND